MSSAVDALRRLPWYSTDMPREALDSRGMIFDDERRLLYVLARDYFTGAGAIIDGGSYLGDSSLALGYGLKDRRFPSRKVIHAFDLFTIDAFSIANHLTQDDKKGRIISPGDGVQFIYDERTSAISEYVDVHAGDVTKNPWTGGPIEIAFSDVSKSWGVNDYILMNWFPSLIPRTGILIQQDQVQQYHVWIAITMEMLASHFECLDYVRNSSMVYRLINEIPQADLIRCLTANVTNDDMERSYQSYLARFRSVGMGRYSGWHLGMVEIGLIATYGLHMGDFDKARHAYRICEERFAHIPDTLYRLREIKQHLDDETPCPGAKLGW